MMGVLVVARLALTGSVAQADETGEGTPPLPSAAPLDAAPPPPPKVDVPAKLRGRLVEVTTVDGKIEGKLFLHQ